MSQPEIVYYAPDTGPLVSSVDDALSVLGDAMSIGASQVVIPVARLSPAFLDLSSGLAGDILQKFSNYRMKVVLFGDITTALEASSALRTFVAESNRGEGVWFAPDQEALDARLAGSRT
jgi:hypothetical protein